MRPHVLFPLFRDLRSLPGMGPSTAPLLARSVGIKGEGDARVVDLLWHRPTGLVDRRRVCAVAEAPLDQVVTLSVIVDDHLAPSGPRSPRRVRCRDESGFVELVFFHAKQGWLDKTLPRGERRVVSGRIDLFGDRRQMLHPDHVVPESALAEIARLETTYPITGGLHAKVKARTIDHAVSVVEAMAPLPEWIDPALLAREGWPAWRDALLTLHRPESLADLDPEGPARRRLAYDEMLSTQLALLLLRARLRDRPGRPLVGTGRLRAAVIAALPFALTGSQTAALAEIDADLAQPRRMLRLLQGDVGSGKTVVALLAMLSAVEAGCQAALLAPTEILARQHLETMAPLCRAADVPITLLTGRDKGRARDALLADLASGLTPLVVGTHALISEDVAFRDLAMVVVDEQHRFGVDQRLRLSEKGRGVDVLVMTATPIPRTLELTAFGDMDASRLTEKPPGRVPVDTRALPVDRLADVVAAVRRKLEAGEKIYWVCPLVEETEGGDRALVDATLRATSLIASLGGEDALGGRVGLVHGRMKGPEKDAVMARFSDGDLGLLVATTVIEVGVNVPDATVMVIEHAERFGLAQLHQLRGRVGRGDRPSTCVLLYQPPLGETARRRLETIRGTEDGFLIAEEDLRLRGAGEVLGTRQSGLPELKIADLAADDDLLAIARDDARLVLAKDPTLDGPRGQALRVLLYLFERDAAVRYLRSG